VRLTLGLRESSEACVLTIDHVSFNFRSDKGVIRETTADEMSVTLRPGNVVFDTEDPKGLSEFWAALTGYEQRTLSEDSVSLRDPSGRGAHLTFQGRDVDDVVGSRSHIEFYADDPDDVAERALQLGGDFVRRASDGDVRWVVLTDPDGNEFSVVVSGPDRVP
jgi:predicted enzyme related to lactoylglutathione lyase